MTRGDDPIGVFLEAVIEDAGFRQAISSGNEQMIRAALSSKSVSLPSTYQDQVVDACLAISGQNGWIALDQLRKALSQEALGTLN